MSVFAKEIAVRRLSKSRPALRRPAWWPTARSPNRQRNRVRLPAYPRADVRISKSLQWKSWRATLFAEIMNLANRDNERYDSFGGYNAQTRQAFPRFDKLFQSSQPPHHVRMGRPRLAPLNLIRLIATQDAN